MALSRGMRAWVVRLYPSDWRARYGDEFATFLEDCRLTPFALFDVCLGALDARLTPFDATGRIMRMLHQPRRSVITVFIAYIAFVLAGGSYSNMIEDDVKTLNPAHPAVAAAYNVVAVTAVVALAAVLVGGLPIGWAVFRRALAGRRWDILGLLAVPPLSLAIWIGWTLFMVNVVSSSVDIQTAPRPTVALFFFSWVGLFLLAAIASTAAVTIAVSRSEIPTRLYRFALGPAAVAVLAMGMVFVAVLVWGLLVQSQVPSYLSEPVGPRPYTIPVMTGWVVDLMVMASAILVAATALIRAWRTPPPSSEVVPSVGAA